jgi:hypothetical protein
VKKVYSVQFRFMCLPVSRLFWVSSLAYPNLLGTKCYVVVVVVVAISI